MYSGNDMKPYRKPRPCAVYREERKNENGDWVCSRMTYDTRLYAQWKDGYFRSVRRYGFPPASIECRFMHAQLEWEDDIQHDL